MAVAMLLGNAAFASDAAGPPASAAAARQSGGQQEQSGGQLQQVVVTATRHAQPVNKVPISVQAFTQKSLDDLHISSFADLASYVPGVTLEASEGGGQNSEDVAIRGIFSNGNAPTTQIYIDETPIAVRVMNNAGPQGNPYPDIFDLDRVEVLRGPQGTLFGSSAMGGVIRYITPQPDLYSSSGFAKMDIGDTDGSGQPNYEYGVAYGAPISSGVAAFRISFWDQSNSGWINRVDPFTGLVLDPDANSSNSYVLRPAFTIQPIDGLTITPAIFIQHTHSDDPDSYWVTYVPQADQGVRSSGSVPEPATDDLRVPSLAVKYELAGATFESNTSYVNRQYKDIDDFTHTMEAIYSGMPFIPGLDSFVSRFEDFEFNHAWQQEFRLTSANPDSRISWVTGAYYRYAVTGDSQLIPPDLSPITEAIAGETSLQYTGFPDYYVDGVALNSYTNFRTIDVSKALFGQLTIGIIGGLKASLGVRGEHSIVNGQREIIAGPLNGLTYSSSVLPDQIANPVTPRAGLTYEINDNDMVYATVAKGYRSGGGNANDAVGNYLCQPSLEALGLTSVPKSFDSDSLWSYEVGTKDSMLDRHMALQVSAYDIIWTGIQTQVALPSCAEGFTANRGKAISRGVDLQLQALVGEHLQLNFSAGYDDAFYPDAEYGGTTNGVAPVLVAAGEKLPNVVPWSAAANANYSWSMDHLWSGAKPYVRLDYRIQAAVVSLDPNVAGYDPAVGPYQGDGYGLLNIRFGVTNNGLDLSLYMRNATNADPLLGYNHSPIGDPLFQATAIRPRTSGITATYIF